jgi:diguanylate cyclase (GGDEF)-like protein/PAS domain S-box-containing protein
MTQVSGRAQGQHRLRRGAIELTALVGAYALLRAGELAGTTPLWGYALIAVWVTIAGSLAQAAWPQLVTTRQVHARMALLVPAAVALIYATGWGAGLVMALAFVVADTVKSGGSRTAGVALLWCLGGVAGGQAAIVAGIAPSAVPDPGVHGLAALGALGLALVSHRIARLSADSERAQAEVTASEERFRSLVQNSSDVMVLVGDDARVSYVSPSSERLYGIRPADVVGSNFLDLIHPDDLPEIRRFVADVVARPGSIGLVECRLRDGSGQWRHIQTVGNNLLDDANVRGFVLNLRDVTERKTLEEQLEHRAFHDPLTNLANRALFQDRVEHAMARQARRPEPIAVLYIDLDGFKNVNDSLGHAAGDELLAAAADRLLLCVRDIDTAARLGGDEFAVLLEDLRDESSAARVAERILGQIRLPFTVREQEVRLDASIGIAVHHGDVEGTEDLLRNADIAMYMAKGAGKGRYEIFEPSMHLAAVERLDLEAALRRAVERQEFLLHYQPIVELDSARIIGLEALVRWVHPERGMVSPADFIPLAEETGLIVPIGRWVLQEACRAAAAWQGEYDTHPPLGMSVNLSARQLQHAGVVDDVRQSLEAAGIDASTLTLEITETALVQDTEVTIARLCQLKALGVRLAVDDFGTGYSSLAYLQRFPVDVLKIDRSFIDGIDRDAVNPALVRAIVELGRTLELETVAEGIERNDQLDQFRELQCQHGQGFFFARPADRASIDELFARQGWPRGIPYEPPSASSRAGSIR